MTPVLLVVCFLRLDLTTGVISGRQWERDEPVPLGSLAKPFVALGYAQYHQFHYPKVNCRSHGEVGIVEAIAQSCNTYFDMLRAQVPEDALPALARRFGLDSFDLARPEPLLRAYVELVQRGAEPGVAEILAGMRQAARTGTAKDLNMDAYAKTGTAACTHSPRAPGDGFAVVLHPAGKPRTALLVRLHSRPGAHAAREAGRLLR
ncbi:MAG: hypothetical protein HY235_18495 [Acidobacteria bacterium]|nr:hypothetical protein [Acidobacteriota bacterium]